VDLVSKLSKGFKNKDNMGQGLDPVGSKRFDILDYLDKLDVSAAHALLPAGWDFDELVRKYNTWVNEQGEPPIKPRVAFSTWIRKYTAGQPPGERAKA
jgi:hypothetical protein